MKTFAFCVAAAAVALAACGPARRSEPAAGAFKPQNESERRGEALFDRHCSKCHTGGEAGLGPGINDKPFPVPLMKLQTRKGLGAMPGFPEREISEQELDDLMAYIVALRRQKGFTGAREAPGERRVAALESR
jgi:mono/diheme cytochrome c family protein